MPNNAPMAQMTMPSIISVCPLTPPKPVKLDGAEVGDFDVGFAGGSGKRQPDGEEEEDA